ncbi:MAG: 1-phosphofructokinase [Eubacteriales bacterium]
MIVTVTMNPAIDKTIDVGSLQVGKLNRIQRVELDAGGKGINVSKTIQALGGTSIATGFIGGNAGQTIVNVLQGLNITTDFVLVNGEVRTNTKVFEENGNLTELNEPGFVISKQELDALLLKLEGYADENTLFILAGSIPKGVPTDIYGKITELVHGKGAKVLMDADGELFKKALPAIPDMIKPNKDELAEYASIEGGATEEEVLKVAKSFLDTGIGTIAISMGGNGAMMMQGEKQVRCPVLSVKIHSTVGAGDAMVAAMAYAFEEKLEFEEMVKLSLATSAGAVTTIGTKPPTREVVEELKKQVVIEEIR